MKNLDLKHSQKNENDGVVDRFNLYSILLTSADVGIYTIYQSITVWENKNTNMIDIFKYNFGKSFFTLNN